MSGVGVYHDDNSPRETQLTAMVGTEMGSPFKSDGNQDMLTQRRDDDAAYNDDDDEINLDEMIFMDEAE